MKYGMLTFLRDCPPPKFVRNQRNKYALWKCDCGREKAIVIRDVVNGGSRSCGCASKRGMRAAMAAHFAAYRAEQKRKGIA